MDLAQQFNESRRAVCVPGAPPKFTLQKDKVVEGLRVFSETLDMSDITEDGVQFPCREVSRRVLFRVHEAIRETKSHPNPYLSRIADNVLAGPELIATFSEVSARLAHVKMGGESPSTARKILGSDELLGAIKEVGRSHPFAATALLSVLSTYEFAHGNRRVAIGRNTLLPGKIGFMEQNFTFNSEDRLCLTKGTFEKQKSKLARLDARKGFCPALMLVMEQGKTFFEEFADWIRRQHLRHDLMQVRRSPWFYLDQTQILESKAQTLGLNKALYLPRAA